jgi:hypothetical protein
VTDSDVAIGDDDVVIDVIRGRIIVFILRADPEPECLLDQRCCLGRVICRENFDTAIALRRKAVSGVTFRLPARSP